MHKHYLLAVHKAPNQVARLVRALAGPDAEFWIHVDAKSDAGPFRAALPDDGVHWVEPRVNCIWGGYSQVEATLGCLRAALASERPGYVLYASGQDYPIASNDDIDAYVSGHADTVHLDTGPIDQVWPEMYDVKVSHYCIPQSAKHGDLLLLPALSSMTIRGVVGWTLRLMRTFGSLPGLRHAAALLPPRTMPFGMPHGGSSWWGMPWDVARTMLEWVDARPAFARYFRYSQCPDEMFFHTALAGLEADGVALKRQENLTYIDWSQATAGSPKILTVDDLDTLVRQPPHKLFARKFDETVDADVLDALDRRFGREAR